MLHFGDLIELPAIAVRAVRGGSGATWPVHDVIEGKPRRQFIGPTAPELTVSLFLHVAYIAPRPTLTTLQRIATSGEVFQVWTSSGAFWGTFELEKVDHAIRWQLPTGQIIAMSVELQLVDPGLEVVAELTKPAAVSGNAFNTTAVKPPEDTSAPPESITPQQIARL